MSQTNLPDPESFHRFPSTHWTDLEVASTWRDSTAGQESLSRMFLRYSGAMTCYLSLVMGDYLRWARLDPKDVVQDFFVEQVVEKNFLKSAKRERGSRFRSFLRLCLYRFAIGKVRKNTKKTDITSNHLLSIESDILDDSASLYDFSNLNSKTPDTQTLFDIEWYTSLFVRSLKTYFQQEPTPTQAVQIKAFQMRYLQPLLSGLQPASIPDIMSTLGIRSRKTASLKAIRGRNSFQDAVRKEFSIYCSTKIQIAEEESNLSFVFKNNFQRIAEIVRQEL